MSPEIELESFDERNFIELLDLANSTYAGHEISDRDYLEWEYNKNPHGKAIINVARIFDRIVSQYVVLPRIFNHNGNSIKGSLSVNTLTNPNSRGKNLFPELAEKTFRQCAEKEILFTIGFPNPVSLPVIRSKNIFHVDGALSVLFKPLNPLRTFSSYVFGKKDKTGNDIPLQFDKMKNSNVTIFELCSTDSSFNELLKTFHAHKFLTTFRNADFIRWRYVDIPRRKYFAIAHASGKTNAILIFRAKYVYGIKCLVVVDIISSDQNSVRESMKELKYIARKNKIDLIFSAFTPHSEEYSTLKSSGYFSIPEFILPQKLAFIVRKHREDCPDEVMHFKNWYLTFGDYDIF